MGKEKLLPDETANLLNNEGKIPFDISPNGEIRANGESPDGVTPSTVGSDLGGEFDSTAR